MTFSAHSDWTVQGRADQNYKDNTRNADPVIGRYPILVVVSCTKSGRINLSPACETLVAIDLSFRGSK